VFTQWAESKPGAQQNRHRQAQHDGSPGIRFQGQAPGLTHYVHPKLVGATAYLLAAPARAASVL